MFGIFKNQYSDRQRQMFADQFEPDGEGYLFRKSQKGPAIRVSAAERAGFIADYDRRLRHATWIILIGMALLLLVVVFWSITTGSDLSDPIMYTVIGGLAALSVGYMIWSSGAPARQLQRRTPVSGERSREEMKRRILAQTTYGQIASIAAVGALSIGTAIQHRAVSSWGRFWLALGGFTILLAVIAAIRKWRFDRR